MDFMRRGSLADQVQDSPPVRTVIRWLVALARAVHHAHRRHVVHGDLKPSNVLLDNVGRPVLSDFGLAQLHAGDSPAPLRLLAGSPAYMAPEQFAGAGQPITPSVDIWALGVILYELLGGQRPFVAPGFLDLVHCVRFQEAAPLASLVPAIPDCLEEICACCLAKHPAERYASAAELAGDLRKCLA
jgi:serine/threonine protein kinase